MVNSGRDGLSIQPIQSEAAGSPVPPDPGACRPLPGHRMCDPARGIGRGSGLAASGDAIPKFTTNERAALAYLLPAYPAGYLAADMPPNVLQGVDRLMIRHTLNPLITADATTFTLTRWGSVHAVEVQTADRVRARLKASKR